MNIFITCLHLKFKKIKMYPPRNVNRKFELYKIDRYAIQKAKMSAVLQPFLENGLFFFHYGQ